MRCLALAFCLQKTEGKGSHMFFKNLFSAKKPSGGVEFLIVGLGNPGAKYEKTRHNAGFIAIDHIARQTGATVSRLKYKALCGNAVLGGKRVLLMKPQTFMNNSGEAVREAMAFYKIPPERAIILFDDISLKPGALRIRRKGSHGGHNGMKSIQALAGSDQFPRIKLGIGAKPDPRWDLADWVLSEFSKEELALVEEAAAHACAACELMVNGQTDQAMNRFNS